MKKNILLRLFWLVTSSLYASDQENKASRLRRLQHQPKASQVVNKTEPKTARTSVSDKDLKLLKTVNPILSDTDKAAVEDQLIKDYESFRKRERMLESFRNEGLFKVDTLDVELEEQEKEFEKKYNQDFMKLKESQEQQKLENEKISQELHQKQQQKLAKQELSKRQQLEQENLKKQQEFIENQEQFLRSSHEQESNQGFVDFDRQAESLKKLNEYIRQHQKQQELDKELDARTQRVWERLYGPQVKQPGWYERMKNMVRRALPSSSQTKFVDMDTLPEAH